MDAPQLPSTRDHRLLWAVATVPPAIWGIHLVYAAGMVHLTCSHPDLRWTLYVGTIIPAALVAGLTALAARRLRQSPAADPDGASEADQLNFLGYLAVLVGLVNVLLIVAEGIVIPFLSSCA
jgi:hypothetical protein